MKNIFTPEIKKTLFESVFIALLVFLTQNYLQKLWVPDTAAETLKRENYISSKKDTYFETINIVNRIFSDFKFSNIKNDSNYVRLKGTTYPTEFEVNSCLSKLYLYTDNEQIISSFKKICAFKNGISGDIVKSNIELLKNIKSDLAGKSDSKIIDTYEYIMVNRDTTFK